MSTELEQLAIELWDKMENSAQSGEEQIRFATETLREVQRQTIEACARSKSGLEICAGK